MQGELTEEQVEEVELGVYAADRPEVDEGPAGAEAAEVVGEDAGAESGYAQMQEVLA